MNTWILQSHPKDYDVSAYLLKYDVVYWGVGRSKNKVPVVGDEAFIWRALGDAKPSGVIAHGVIVEGLTKASDVRFPKNRGEEFWTQDNRESDYVVGVRLDDKRLDEEMGMVLRQRLKEDDILRKSLIITMPQRTAFQLKADETARIHVLWPSTLMNPKFLDYIDTLDIAEHSKSNYRTYARRIEKYGRGVLDVAMLQDPSKVGQFIDQLAKRWDAESEETDRLPFTDQRKSDVKTILRHYLDFLNGIDDEVSEVQHELESENAFDATDKQESKEKVLRSIALRRGQVKFRQELLRAYAGRCAFTGTPVSDVLEAAHIIPYNGPSTNHVTNGLLLRSDVHALFDLGLISIDPEGLTIYCSERVQGEPMYAALSGKRLNLPEKAQEQPSLTALQIHFAERK